MMNPFEAGYPAADDLLLVPRKGILKSRNDAEISSFIYSAPMDRVTGYWLTKKMLELNEFPVVSRFLPEEERIRCIREFHSTPAFFAIGGTPEHIKKFLTEINTAIKIDEKDFTHLNVAIDIAHGHSTTGLEAISFLHKECPFVRNIMSGSIATRSAALDCVEAGATHLRVGIGPGSACTTRLMTGIGVPNISAVYHIAREIGNGAAIIADGGIKNPGDAVKYLAAGAHGVMMGHEFAKTFESPGWDVRLPDYTGQTLMCGPNGRDLPKLYVKTYRGQASAEFQQDRSGEASWCPEGASSKEMVWDGSTVETLIMKYRGGLASAISYLGLSKMSELTPEYVEFIQITNAGRIESVDHVNLK